MHAPEGGWVARGDLILEIGLVGKELCSIVAVDGERFWEGGLLCEGIVDAPGLEEAGCVGGQLKAGLGSGR